MFHELSMIMREGGSGVLLSLGLSVFGLLWAALLGGLQGAGRMRVPAPLWIAPTCLLLALAGGQWLLSLHEIFEVLPMVEPGQRYKLMVEGMSQAARALSFMLALATLHAAVAGISLGLASYLGAGAPARRTPGQLVGPALACLVAVGAAIGVVWCWPQGVISWVAAAGLLAAMAVMSLGALVIGEQPEDEARGAAARVTLGLIASLMAASASAACFGFMFRSGALLAHHRGFAGLTELDQRLGLALVLGAASALLAGPLMALAASAYKLTTPRHIVSAALCALMVAAAAAPLGAAFTEHFKIMSAVSSQALAELPAGMPEVEPRLDERALGHHLIYERGDGLVMVPIASESASPEREQSCAASGTVLSEPLCPSHAGVPALIAVNAALPARALAALAPQAGALEASVVFKGEGAYAQPTWLRGLEFATLRGARITISGADRWRVGEDGLSLVADAAEGQAQVMRVVVDGATLHTPDASAPLPPRGERGDAAQVVAGLVGVVATPELTVAGLLARCAQLAAGGSCVLLPALPAGYKVKPEAALGDDDLSAALGAGDVGAPGPASSARSGVPTVRVEPPTVGPGPMRDVIKRVIKTHQNGIRYCYERGLQRNPELAGSIKVKFTIGLDGAVAVAAVESSTIGDAEVEACVVKRVKSMRFPEPEGGVVIITYPFSFTTAGD